ncbi:MAG: HEAT repeat domain-containing protein [Verrucomicrobiales bacterium]|nr:HEAT repeat domain-containing protein [Verrucomicrobiales bacterium]
MTTIVQASKPRSKWRVCLLVGITIVGGLLLGAALGLLAENKPFEQRSVAHLVRDLRKTDSPIDRLRQKLWPVLPDVLTERLSHFAPMPASVVRQLAAVELRRRAPAGVEAVPALVRALSDAHSGVRGMVLQALAGFGPAAAVAVPQVLPMLELTGNPVLRSESARTLIAIAPDKPEVRARLLSILRDRATPDSLTANTRKANASQEALRSAVFRIVDKLARPDEDVVPLLLSELVQADAASAVEIIGTLQRIGPVSPAIIPAVMQKLKEAQHSRRLADGRPIDSGGASQRDDLIAAALRAIQRLARTDNDAVPLLIGTLPEADPVLAARILRTLGLIGPLTPQVIPTLAAALPAHDARIQMGAISAIGTMGAKAASAVPDLVRLLEAQRSGLTNEPAVASVEEREFKQGVLVAEFDPTGRQMFPGTLEPAWDDAGPPRMRMRPVRVLREPELMTLRLVQSLARIGPEAAEAVPTLEKVMAEIKGELRYETALTLWQIERTNAAAQTVLIEGLNIPTPEFPRRLIRHFRSMGVGDLPILDAALDHIDEEIRLAAFGIVSTLALDTEPALLALERIADDSTSPLQGQAVRALEAILWQPVHGQKAP